MRINADQRLEAGNDALAGRLPGNIPLEHRCVLRYISYRSFTAIPVLMQAGDGQERQEMESAGRVQALPPNPITGGICSYGPLSSH
jgi:hypothetical protein